MSQIIITPHCLYKVFRKLVQGYVGVSSELPDGYYIDKSIMGDVSNLKYFKLGIGGPVSGGLTTELTRGYFDLYCKDLISVKGDLCYPIPLYAPGGGYGADRFKKELLPANFYPYGTSPDSVVVGVLGVDADGPTDPGYGKYWNIPGVAFQVGCHLTAAEGNYIPNLTPAYDPNTFDPTAVAWPPISWSAVASPDIVAVNEVGIFDEDDVMCLYGVFAKQSKNNTLTIKVNNVAMQKTLDFNLVITP